MGGQCGTLVCSRLLREPARPKYSFDLADEARWLAHLRDRGFVVIRQVGDAEQVRAAKELLWDAIINRSKDTVRDDPKTWNFSIQETGLTPWLAQTAGAWAVRGWPRVKQAYSRIWGTEDLIVSMDCVLLWRPWSIKSTWKPQTEGLHLDQNPFDRVDLESVQGMVPLLPVDGTTGGLRVVPDSNQPRSKEEFKQTHMHMRGSGDWCPCDDDDLQEKAVLLHANPGDLVLWDARTIHGGVVGTGQCESGAAAELARMSITVSMTPRAWASDFVQKRRAEGFRKGENFNHVPHEAGTSTGTVRAPVRKNFKPPELTGAQLALL